MDFGNGNTYGNFVKVPGAFLLKKRFSRSELEIMRHPHGTCVKFRSWGGERQGAKNPTDYVDFVWELPHKQKVDADGKPVFDEKGHPVMARLCARHMGSVGNRDRQRHKRRPGYLCSYR